MSPASAQEMSRKHQRQRMKLVRAREPSGRVSRATADDIDAVSPTAAKRLRDAAARGASDMEWGTEIGRLFLAGEITAPEYEAAKRWGRLVARWHRAIGAYHPYPGPGPVAFLGTVRGRDAGDDPHVDSKEGKKLRAERMHTIDEMQEAHAILIGAGMMAEAAVRGTCEANENTTALYGLGNLKRGLNWLAKWWGLTT